MKKENINSQTVRPHDLEEKLGDLVMGISDYRGTVRTKSKVVFISLDCFGVSCLVLEISAVEIYWNYFLSDIKTAHNKVCGLSCVTWS